MTYVAPGIRIKEITFDDYEPIAIITTANAASEEGMIRAFLKTLGRKLPIPVGFKNHVPVKRIVRNALGREVLIGKARVFYDAAYAKRQMTLRIYNNELDKDELAAVREQLEQQVGMPVKIKRKKLPPVSPAIIARLKEILPEGIGIQSALYKKKNNKILVFAHNAELYKRLSRKKKKELSEQLGATIEVYQTADYQAHPVFKEFKASVGDVMQSGVPILGEPVHTDQVSLVGLGACEAIDGSGFALNLRGATILFDCGTDHKGQLRLPLASVGNHDNMAVVITHAHLDHVGALPMLYHLGFRGRTIMTEPTLVHSLINWRDSLNIARMEGRSAGFTTADVRRTVENTKILNYDQTLRLAEGVAIRLLNAGHIIGSAMVETTITHDEQKKVIIYTGDASFKDSNILQGAKLPEQADVVIMDSTHLMEEFPDYNQRAQELRKAVSGVIRGKGTVLIPSFGIGRSQEVLEILRPIAEGQQFPVYIDGMIKTTNEAIRYFLADGARHYLQPQLMYHETKAFGTGNFIEINPRDRTWLVKNRQPKVIVSTAGMLFGLSRMYFDHLASRGNNMLLFPGYQAAGTYGRYILDNHEHMQTVRTSEGQTVPFKARVMKVPLSAHSDQKEVDAALAGKDIGSILLVHGDQDRMEKAEDYFKAVHGIPTTRVKKGVSYSL
jgi:predicted metal-dependent RNase